LVDQLTSQHCEELGVVQCGQPFAMEIEAIDAFNNRCCNHSLCSQPAACERRTHALGS
jgi:hypothetical protein